jgi:hypothetical protein
MTSTSNSGHNSNVTSFQSLINCCSGYGPTYNPGTGALQLLQLQMLLANSQSCMLNVYNNYTAYKNATNDREILFDSTQPLAKKVMATLKSCGVTKQTIADAETINRLIQGRRAKLTKADAGKTEPASEEATADKPEKKTISVSRQTFGDIVEHFTKLSTLLNTIPQYAPNEQDLSVAGLNLFISNLQNSITSVTSTRTGWSNALNARDQILYDDVSGLVDVAKAAQNYVKGVFGSKSAQYKQIAALKFKKIKRK